MMVVDPENQLYHGFWQYIMTIYMANIKTGNNLAQSLSHV